MRPCCTSARIGRQPRKVRLPSSDILLQREGWEVNAKWVYRLYAEEGLKVQTRRRKERTQRQRLPPGQAVRRNEKRSMDFVAQRLADGRWIRVLTIVDQDTRECLNIHRFMDLKEACYLIEAWMQEYNESRFHASLDSRTPSDFASQITARRSLCATTLDQGKTLSLIHKTTPFNVALL